MSNSPMKTTKNKYRNHGKSQMSHQVSPTKRKQAPSALNDELTLPKVANFHHQKKNSHLAVPAKF
jgi:hypothetical protein